MSSKPGKRREAREAALQFLYSHDLQAQPDERDLAAFWELRPMRPDARAFAEELINGVLEKWPLLDEHLLKHVRNYELQRVAAVDRNILRLAIFELLERPGTPQPVVINEAIEIAKRFGSPDSSRFVNGILDSVRKAMQH